MDPRVRIVAVADLLKEKAKSFQEKYKIEQEYRDFRKLLNRKDIQAVSICFPSRRSRVRASSPAPFSLNILAVLTLLTRYVS